MIDFEEYKRLGEPEKAEKTANWRIAIGLQQAEGLTPSAYLIKLAKQHIEGEITIHEVKERLNDYYKAKRVKTADDDTVNDTVNAQNATVNPQVGTANDTVFSLIKSNNKITAVGITEKLGISLRTVKRKIKELKDNGIITRIGSDKTGSWKILKTE